MDGKTHRIACSNHPDVDAVEKCIDCRKFYCRECVTKINGKYHCLQCLDLLSNLSDKIGFEEKYNLRKLRFVTGGCFVLFLTAIIIAILALLVPYLRMSSAISCTKQLKQLYKVLQVYAEANDGRFPPNNNDLTLLYSPEYSRGVDLFEVLKCPGTENIVAIHDHLKDDSSATVGTGMSYFYQGGLSISSDEDDSVPLLWDQSSSNHKGRGINVLYTNGRIVFYEKDFPELKQIPPLQRENSSSFPPQ